MGDARAFSWPPIGSEEDLRRRLSLVTPADTTRGLFLNGVLESVRQLGSEDTVRYCLGESGEQHFVELFSYPLVTLLRMAYAGARRLSDDTRSFSEVMRQMGYLSARSFSSSKMGGMMLKMIIGKPRLLLDTLPLAHRMSTSAGDCKVRWMGHTQAIVRITRDFLPPSYTEGSLQGAFEIAKIRSLTVRAFPTESLDNEYELTWE
jgi:uncharacterized protein (TIGR02265 family)